VVSNDEIREYLDKKYGFKPKNTWIAHAKEVYGVPTKPASNRKSKERRWPCPKKRLTQIKDAFMHFEILDS